MSKKIDIKSIISGFKKSKPRLLRHAPFAAIIFVLIIYFITVLRVSHLVTAEPSESAQSSALASSNPPKVDPKAIQQIQNLEQNSPQLHSLFDSARNNPFNE